MKRSYKISFIKKIKHSIRVGLVLLAIFIIPPLANAAPGAILYQNQFSTNGDISSDWSRTSGGGNDFQASTSTFNSGPRSLRIRDGSGGISNSGLINAAVPGADVTFWLRQGSPSNAPESGENLQFYYLNSSNVWVLLNTYQGSDAAGTIYNATFTLPVDALHANLRFQFNMTSGGNNDRWYVDDFTVTETGAAVLFTCDNFESGLNNWIVSSSGGIAGISNATSNSTSNSLYTAWGTVSVSSVTIDTSSLTTVGVTAWFRRGSDAFSEYPDNNEDLVISYLDSSSSWVVLETFPGGGTAGEIFTRNYQLPAVAIHSNFQLKIEQTAGSNSDYDYWHIDDVCVEEYVPPPPLVCDDFENGLINWSISSNGGNAGTSGATFNSASNSLYTRWGDVTLSSTPVDTSSFASVEVTAWVQRGSDAFSEYPDNTEDLVISYLDSNFVWVVLETFAGGGAAAEIFSRTYNLPATAIHNNFQLQIRQLGGSGSNYDYWHLDDVCIQEPPLPALDHIQISHDGSALTCADEILNIKACTDAACTSVASADVDVTLSATGIGASSWSSNPVTIPANSSSGVNVSLTHRTAETVTLGVTSTPVATNPLVCSPAGCTLTFSDAGFLLNLANHQSCSVPNLTIQAVKMSDTGTSCAAAYTGNQSVNFEFNYINPITGGRVPNLAATPMAAAGITQNRTINFNGTASATLTFEYRDAGQIGITVSEGADDGLSSATVTPIVKPAKLIVSTTDANNACTGPNFGNCSAFKVAGTAANVPSQFNLDVEGACADNSVTPNFQLNSIPLTSNLVAPSGGSNASLGVTSVNIVSAGSVTVSQTVSEVGAFSITATPPNYLGQPLAAATSSTIGRFIPDRFIITENAPLFADATCDFTYQGQTFDFAPGLNPEITLTAVNSAGAPTVNYGGDGVANHDFWKLDSSLFVSRSYTNHVAAFPGTLTSSLGGITTAGETNYDGVNTFAFTTDQLTYNKSAATPVATNDAAFNARVKLNLTAASLTDNDGVFYDYNNDDVVDAYATADANIFTGTNIRWGRWFLANAFGSELQPLTMVAEAQYFNGTNFVSSSTDTCTAPVTVSLSNYSGNLNAGDTTLSQAAMVSGLIPLTLSAPGNGKDGSLLMILTTPAWMLYDYDGDSTADNASATATFGIFEGRQPVIIKRQQF